MIKNTHCSWFFGSRTGKKKSVLFVSTVWPEYKSSAAGVRTRQLIDLFIETGYEVSYVSTSAQNESSQELRERTKMETHYCLPNRPMEFRKIIERVNPTICVFDRFLYTDISISIGENDNSCFSFLFGSASPIQILLRGTIFFSSARASTRLSTNH